MRKLLVFTLALCPLLLAQEVIDQNTNWKIRREENEHSQVMRTAHVLTDRYGPRLTGSPNYEAAAKWAVAQLTEWGLKNAHLEAWDFGHPGWTNERAWGVMTAPVTRNLSFEVLAWTPSTNGTAAGPAVQLIPPQSPTKDELTAWLDASASKVRGKVVLVGKAAVIPVSFNPVNKRSDDAELRARYDSPSPSPMGPPRQAPAAQPRPGALPANEVARMIDEWLVANGALVRVNDSGMGYGHIRAFQNRTYDITKAVPTVVLRNEDFGRIERLLADKENVQLEFNIVNHTYPDGKTSYNVVAEIPGAEKPDEVVMLGGHLDSWHAATGATDDASGCAVMMEAVRLIQTLGLKPRRTVRIALWAAEEQGLLGSQAYVKEHFGTFEEQKPDYSKFVAYFNVDSGTGRLRGADDAQILERRERLTQHGRGLPHAKPGRHRQHFVQCGRAGRHQPGAGPDRVLQRHLAYEPRHLRTIGAGGPGTGQHRRSRRSLAPGQPRAAAAALHQGADARAAESARSRQARGRIEIRTSSR